MKKVLIIITILMVSSSVMAQREAMYSHYMYNMAAFNPAFTGSLDAISIVMLHRSQWVDVDGAPTTQTFNINSPIYSNMGLGLSVINDKIGYENNTNINIDYSYTIKVSTKAKLAFGLKAGLNMYNIDLSAIAADHPDDPVFSSGDESSLLPNFGFGAYYYTDKYYFGFSIPKLLELDLQNNTVASSASLTDKRKHYYFSAGTVFDLNPEIKIKPAALLKVANGAPIELDMSALMIMGDIFMLGGRYRVGSDIGFLMGLKVIDGLEFGYSYDWATGTNIGSNTDGSHEIILRYNLARKKATE